MTAKRWGQLTCAMQIKSTVKRRKPDQQIINCGAQIKRTFLVMSDKNTQVKFNYDNFRTQRYNNKTNGQNNLIMQKNN